MMISWLKEGMTMTLWQSIMLSACFGFTLGMMIAIYASIIKSAIEKHREKKNKVKE